MLASAATIKVVAETLREWQDKTGKKLRIVLDPVRYLKFAGYFFLSNSNDVDR